MTTDTFDARPLLDAQEHVEEAKKEIFTAIRRLDSVSADTEAELLRKAIAHLAEAERLIIERGTSDLRARVIGGVE